jgi:hypothetical protein
MGYYTRFTLTIREFNNPTNKIRFEDVPANSKLMKMIREGSDGYLDKSYALEEPQKWYKCHEHMSAISKLCPSLIFILEGEGEKNGDMWIAFYFKGDSIYRKLDTSLPDFGEKHIECGLTYMLDPYEENKA